MKVTVTFEVSDNSADILLRNSVERVINTTTGILGEIDQAGVEDAAAEELQVNIEDWEMCKPIAVNTWNAVRDAVFRGCNGNTPQIRDWVV